MPARKMKWGINVTYDDVPEYFRRRLELVHRAMDKWTTQVLYPEIQKETPYYLHSKFRGWDPRVQWHPVGMIKRNLYLRRRRVTDSPFTWLAVSVHKDPVLGYRPYMAIQILHRGWANPPGMRRRGITDRPWTFRITPGETVRKPWMLRGPPPGVAGTERDWIITRKLAPVSKIEQDPFIARNYKRYWAVFKDMATKELLRKRVRVSKKLMRKVKDIKMPRILQKRTYIYRKGRRGR